MPMVSCSSSGIIGDAHDFMIKPSLHLVGQGGFAAARKAVEPYQPAFVGIHDIAVLLGDDRIERDDTRRVCHVGQTPIRLKWRK